MTSKYDITRHIDYENHMKDYIKKADAMQIIDNLKAQLLNMPIQSHPDYKALMTMMSDRHARDMSTLERDLRAKVQVMDIKQHPDYPGLVKYFESRIQQAAATSEKPRDFPSCPTCPTCPTCPSCPVSPAIAQSLPPQQSNAFTVYTRGYTGEPIAANNYPPTEISAEAASDSKIKSFFRTWGY